jgi:hypothetical protein
LSKNREDVTDARRENLRSISGAAKPGVPFSTMKPRMPSSVCAQTDEVRDPHLRAVDHPVLAPALRVSLHVRGIGAAVRLRETEASDELAARHPGQIFLLLLVAAKRIDGIHAERRLHGHEAANAGIAALQFLADEAVADGVEARAPVTFNRGAEQSERRNLRHQLFGEAMLFEALLDDRQHAIVDEACYGLLHHALVFRQ